MELFFFGVRFFSGQKNENSPTGAGHEPLYESDHKVDVWDFFEVLFHQVEPVVDAPQTMHVDTYDLVGVAFSLDLLAI